MSSVKISSRTSVRPSGADLAAVARRGRAPGGGRSARRARSPGAARGLWRFGAVQGGEAAARASRAADELPDRKGIEDFVVC